MEFLTENAFFPAIQVVVLMRKSNTADFLQCKRCAMPLLFGDKSFRSTAGIFELDSYIDDAESGRNQFLHNRKSTFTQAISLMPERKNLTWTLVWQPFYRPPSLGRGIAFSA